MMQKYQTLKLNILSHTTMIHLLVKYLTKIWKNDLAGKSDISGFIANSDLDKKITTLATKAELNSGQDKIVKLEAFDSHYFRGESHFENDGTQNHFEF